MVLLVGPDPISPFLILNALHGTLRIDEAFMCAMDVGMWEALQPLVDFDTTSPLPSRGDHPLNALLLAADINPAHYGSGPLSSQDLDAIEQILVSHMVLGASRLADELDMIAFTEGFFAGHDEREELLGTFNGAERDYLAAMCNQRLDSIDDLLKHIHWESAVDHSKIDLTFVADEGEGPTAKLRLPDSAYDTTYEADFQIAFRHYIEQAGHPDTQVIKEMAGDAFEREAKDRLLRARLFLTIMSGSDLKPVESNWQIKVVFMHTGVRDPDGGRDEEQLPAALNIHACFYQCEVTIDDGVRNLLDQGKPWLEFQSWIHGALLNPEDYNQA